MLVTMIWKNLDLLIQTLQDRGFPNHGFSYGRQRQSMPCHFRLPPKMTRYSCFAWAKQEYQTPAKCNRLPQRAFQQGKKIRAAYLRAAEAAKVVCGDLAVDEGRSAGKEFFGKA